MFDLLTDKAREQGIDFIWTHVPAFCRSIFGTQHNLWTAIAVLLILSAFIFVVWKYGQIIFRSIGKSFKWMINGAMFSYVQSWEYKKELSAFVAELQNYAYNTMTVHEQQSRIESNRLATRLSTFKSYDVVPHRKLVDELERLHSNYWNSCNYLDRTQYELDDEQQLGNVDDTKYKNTVLFIRKKKRECRELASTRIQLAFAVFGKETGILLNI